MLHVNPFPPAAREGREHRVGLVLLRHYATHWGDGLITVFAHPNILCGQRVAHGTITASLVDAVLFVKMQRVDVEAAREREQGISAVVKG